MNAAQFVLAQACLIMICFFLWYQKQDRENPWWVVAFVALIPIAIMVFGGPHP